MGILFLYLSARLLNEFRICSPFSLNVDLGPSPANSLHGHLSLFVVFKFALYIHNFVINSSNSILYNFLYPNCLPCSPWFLIDLCKRHASLQLFRECPVVTAACNDPRITLLLLSLISYLLFLEIFGLGLPRNFLDLFESQLFLFFNLGVDWP